MMTPDEVHDRFCEVSDRLGAGTATEADIEFAAGAATLIAVVLMQRECWPGADAVLDLALEWNRAGLPDAKVIGMREWLGRHRGEH